MKKKAISAMLSLLAAASLFAGCGQDEPAKDKGAAKPAAEKKIADIDLSDAKDGTYSAESTPHELYGNSKITIAIKDHKIESVTFVGFDKDGKLKDESYGAGASDSNRKKAQVAFQGYNTYGKELVKTQQLNKVDAISGATVSYEQFVEAAQAALSEAKK
ncbi:FMN-binding protein [Selenomonas sp. TAMA-11512]|uniref:FMN-binding protein n=1 Tax=Selenomonas sp. TAMA-11512 TaxID=3095337 RepID=UPI0030918780|nr:FMN-binding protein [Selenomonas sp. TAMA-11512]